MNVPSEATGETTTETSAQNDTQYATEAYEQAQPQWGRPITFNDYAPPPTAAGRPLSLNDFAPPQGRPLSLNDYAPPRTAGGYEPLTAPPIGRPMGLNDFAPPPRHLPPIDPHEGDANDEAQPQYNTEFAAMDSNSYAAMPMGFSEELPEQSNIYGEQVEMNSNTELYGNQEAILDAAVWSTEALPAVTEEKTEADGGRRLTIRPPTRQRNVSGAMSRADMIKNAKQLAMTERLGGGKSFFHTNMKDIADLGTGIHLYFAFTRGMGICFFIMSLLALPALIMNGSGHGLETDTIDPMKFSTLSIANLGVNSTMNATTDWCLGNPFTDDPNYVSYIITLCDVLFSLAFIAFTLYFRIKIRAAVAEQNDTVTPAKYAVFVRGLPRSATEEDILKHFNDLYDPTKPRMEYPMYFGCWGKVRPPKRHHNLTSGGHLSKPVANLDHVNGNQLYMNTWIAEISIARPSGGLLRTFLAMDNLTAKAAELRDILETYKGRTAGDKIAEKAIPRLEKELKKVQGNLEKKTNRLKALKRDEGSAYLSQCDSAFVVFNCVESQRRCLHDYRTSTRWYARYFQPKALRFQGVHRLTVKPAPEPSNIIWENLEVSKGERRLRRYFTNFIAFLLLLLTCGIISVAQSAQKAFSKQNIPKFCSEAVPAVFAGGYDAVYNRTWKLAWDPYPTTKVCPANSYFVQYFNKVQVAQPPKNNYTQCLDPCVSVDASLDRVCHTLPCFLPKYEDKHTRPCAKYMASDILQCYCEPKLTNAIKMYGFIQGPKKMYTYEVPCQAYLTNYLSKNAAIVLAAGTVIFVNVFLQMILRAFGEFERHISESELASALVIKLFFAQLLNTGVIVLLVNANWTNVPLPLGLDAIFNGEFDDFVQKWYIAVGVGISTTMLVNSVAPQIAPTIMTFIVGPFKRHFREKSAITQKQLNEVYAGPPFDISLRYPLVLNTVFVTMMYCGGIPILLPIASFACLVTYSCDKLTLMRLYSIRTAYDEALGQLAYSMLPLALLLHLAFSTWMYGNSQFLKSNLLDVSWVLNRIGYDHVGSVDDINTLYENFRDLVSQYDPLGRNGLASKVFRTNVFPMFFFFIIAVCSLFFSQFAQALLLPILDKTIGLLLRLLSFLGASAVKSIHDFISRRKYSQDNSILPQYPNFSGHFKKVVEPSYIVEAEKGYERSANGVLIRKWLVNTPNRDIGDRMLTWEAFTAPVKTYDISANPKYMNAVAEMHKAAKRLKSMTIEKMPHDEPKPAPEVKSATVVPI